MDKKEDIKQVSFDQIEDHIQDVDYMDGNIAFHSDIREIPLKEGAFKTDMCTIAVCIVGKLQVEINTVPYTIQQNHLLICRPNDLVCNCMLSPDFEGGVLCMSQKMVMESFSDSDLWDRAFHFAKNPVIFINEENIRLFQLYGEIIQTKIRNKQTLFRKEIILSLVRAVMYELLASADNYTSDQSESTKQRDVLFKQFIKLLSGCKVKPRYISWYADQLCVTPKYLSTICKQVSGKTAFDWINEYMLIDIRHLLKNSTKSIKEVADYLDFPSISFFGKYCRQHFGMSPTECRKQFRQENAANYESSSSESKSKSKSKSSAAS